MTTRTENLKKITFIVMAILFFVNLSLMEKANWAQRNEIGFRGTSSDQGWHAGTKFMSKTDEIEFLRMTATRLQENQDDLLEKIDQLESKLLAYESQENLPGADRFPDSTRPGSERQ